MTPSYSELQKQWAKRRDDIRALREKGWTYRKISEKYGISQQRVLQIIGKANGKEESKA